MEQSHRDKVFDEKKRSEFLWCLHCERPYERPKARVIAGLELCPYLDCDGDTVLDGWDWETVRVHHQDYPLRPEFGEKYALYD